MPQKNTFSTIDKTLLTAGLMDGFWDRWLVHGVEKEDLERIRSSRFTKDKWLNGWNELANKKIIEASKYKQMKEFNEAELKLQTAGLYFQLNQWLIPERNKEKAHWANVSLRAFELADSVSEYETTYAHFPLDMYQCYGRIRYPENPVGVVIIINPLDSSKEELFTYEVDFLKRDFITVSFDGPGQGQTFISSGLRGSIKSWETFMDDLIDFTYSQFSFLPIHLFGTSSGAAWAVYGSCNPKIFKVVGVSPAFKNEEIRLPDYFMERTSFILEEASMLPSYERMDFINPVLLVHGKKDVMVSDENIYSLYEQLPDGKSLLEFEHEGHCCNYKLQEIRELAAKWFKEGTINNDI
ncbi:alpha/beta hydrolase [Bacillus sp. MUM 13]|uniref:alpha/beta hydrolase n=1 Tax=Bacillus sp. MUM 13 TaxID=1678001 RepID=UPI0008F58B6B|nr:alpha/beta hydrolase [Bacillus sp. MUM 13]OIK09981.1 alpha/beta hydrolase [Bacillus sp. MUM 13]